MAGEIQTEHPHIVQDPGVCGGAPTIRGTRITVLQLAVMWRAGDSAEEILSTYPHLSPAAVYDAISYYLDHQADIDREIELSRAEQVAARYGLEIDEKGFVRPAKDRTGDGQ